MHRKQLHKNTTNVPAKLNAISQRGNGAIWQYFIPSFLRLKHIQMGTNMWFHFLCFLPWFPGGGSGTGPKELPGGLGGPSVDHFGRNESISTFLYPSKSLFPMG